MSEKGYYIYYPKLREGKFEDELKITKHPDSHMDYSYASSEGPLKSRDDVVRRLDEMNVPIDVRPKGFKCQPGYVQFAKVCIKKK